MGVRSAVAVAVAVALCGAALAGGGMASAAGRMASGAGGSAACPRTVAYDPAPVHWKAASRTLVPRGPVAVRLCRYGSGGLAGSAEIRSRARVRHLVRMFDRLRHVPPGAVFSCPSDNGAQIRATFAYPAGRRLVVSVHLSGCEFASNGTLAAFADGSGPASAPGPRLVATLLRLSGGTA